MDVEGHALIMTTSQGIDTLVDAIISPHMHEDMLISWVDLQAMGRIPKGFPNQILGARRRRRKQKQMSTSTAQHYARQTFSQQSKRAGNSNAEKYTSPDRRNGKSHESESRTPAGNGREKKKAGNSNAAKQQEKRTTGKRENARFDKSPKDSLKDELLNDFSDVLSDELSPTPMKTEKPMHITLKKNHLPSKTLSAR